MRIQRSAAHWALVVCTALLSLAMLPLLAHAPLVWQAPASHRDHRRLWQLTPADAHRLAGCPAPVSR